MCARFTVLSDTPIAAAIAGWAIPLSRNNTIWMRWRCAAGIFQRNAVFSRRTSALLHLTICFPRIRWRKRITPRARKIAPDYRPRIPIQAVIEAVSVRLQIFGDVDFLRQRADRGGEIDEFLELRLVLVGELARHVITHHRDRIDDILGSERVLGEVLARLLRVLVDEIDALFPDGGEAPRDVGAAFDEVAGDRAAGRERVAVLVAQDVLGDDAGLERAGDPELAHGRGLRFEGVAGIEGPAGHDIDVLAHVELVDGIVALVEADFGEHCLGGDEVGRSGRRHAARTLEVLERRGGVARARHELLHLIDFALAVHADIHGDAGLLDIGVHRLDGHEHDCRLDLIADHRRYVRRAADESDGLRFDVLFLEEAALDRHEIGQRGRGRKHAHLHLVLRGGRLAQGSDEGSDDGDDRPQRLQPDRLHRITSVIPWRPNISPTLAVAGGARLDP